MGRGIAQLFAQSGHPILLFDNLPGATLSAIASIESIFNKKVEKGQLTSERAREIRVAIKACTALEELASCEVVVEAIVEDAGIKQSLLSALESIVSAETILASNTSSLVIAEIASKCKRPERVVGMHFFNPVPAMKVVEIVPAVRTKTSVVDTLQALISGTGHRAVVAADQPGFLVNHAGRGLYTEGLRILEESVASPADVDGLVREGLGFRMGPFELLDLTGLDVSGKVMETIYNNFQHEPRFRPSSLVRPRLAAGLYGRKTGQGWYGYDDEGNRISDVQSSVRTPLPAGLRVWIDPTADQHLELASIVSAAGGALATSSEQADLCLIQPWGWDASSICSGLKLNPECTVAVDPLPGLSKRRTVMLTAVTSPRSRDWAVQLLSSGQVGVTVINDSPGFILQRVVATIVNIAANIVQRGIATVLDLEDAVQLGLGYPHGPLTLGDQIEGRKILQILTAMHSRTGDPRYRPSLWLSRRVELNLPLTTPEAKR